MECLTFVLVQEPNEVFSSPGQSNHNRRGMGRISPVIKYSAALIYAINNAEKPLVFFENVIVSYWNNLLSKLIGTAQSMSKCFCLCSTRNCFRTFYNNSRTVGHSLLQLNLNSPADSLLFIWLFHTKMSLIKFQIAFFYYCYKPSILRIRLK